MSARVQGGLAGLQPEPLTGVPGELHGPTQCLRAAVARHQRDAGRVQPGDVAAFAAGTLINILPLGVTLECEHGP